MNAVGVGRHRRARLAGAALVVAPIHGDSSGVGGGGGGGKHGVFLSSVYAESPMASRPCSVLSCSPPVLLVNNISRQRRGGEVEQTLVFCDKCHLDELPPCVFIQSDECCFVFAHHCD